MTVLRDRMRALLATLEPRVLTAGFKRDAAVLMPVFERDGEPYFLLTRRTDDVPTHKGQIAFPGGMRNEGESLEATALRETFEEVAIEPREVELLGRYHDYLSSSEFRVVPFAGYLRHPFSTVAQSREVAEVLEVPFAVFRDPARLRVEKMFRLGRWHDVLFYRFGERDVWGLTARMIKDFLDELEA